MTADDKMYADEEANFYAMKTYCVLLAVWALMSCKASAVDAAPDLEAVFVVKETLGCRYPLVRFTTGVEQARQLAGVGETYDGYFGVLNLDQSYWVPGKKLTITIRKASSVTFCDAMGINSPVVDVLAVK